MSASSAVLDLPENLRNHDRCCVVCVFLSVLSIDTRSQASIFAPGIHLLLPIMATQLTQCNRILDVPGWVLSFWLMIHLLHWALGHATAETAPCIRRLSFRPIYVVVHSQALTMRQKSTCLSYNGRPANIRLLQQNHCRVRTNFNFCSSSAILFAQK